MIELLLLCFMNLKWSDAMIRGPIPTSTKPAPTPEPLPPTACFCDSCKPCTCRDGKHSPKCSEGKVKSEPETKPITEEKKVSVEIKPKFRSTGGSGSTYEHEDKDFLERWISINDPRYAGSVCVGGTCKAR